MPKTQPPPKTAVYEALILEPGEKIAKLEKVYWSRKFDQILARLSIIKTAKKGFLGQRAGEDRIRVFPNFKRTIPLAQFRDK